MPTTVRCPLSWALRTARSVLRTALYTRSTGRPCTRVHHVGPTKAPARGCRPTPQRRCSSGLADTIPIDTGGARLSPTRFLFIGAPATSARSPPAMCGAPPSKKRSLLCRAGNRCAGRPCREAQSSPAIKASHWKNQRPLAVEVIEGFAQLHRLEVLRIRPASVSCLTYVSTTTTRGSAKESLPVHNFP